MEIDRKPVSRAQADRPLKLADYIAIVFVLALAVGFVALIDWIGIALHFPHMEG